MNALHERFPSVRREGVVTDFRWWATSAGYEYQANFGNIDIFSAMGTSNDGIAGYGWTQGSGLGFADGATADFLSSADEDPTRLAVAFAGALFSSPRIFGSYDHALQASRFLGYFPTKLTLEIYASFPVNSTNETTTFFGFAGPAVTDSAAAGSAGCIRSGGTASTFFLTSDNGSDAGAAIDAVYHKWRIEVSSASTEWFIDNVSQGTVTTEADIWPTCFTVGSTTNNDIRLTWLRVYYS